MTTITIQEAHAKLTELIHQQAPGGELIITEDGETVARLIVVPKRAAETRKTLQLGTQPGSVLSMEHFDDPLEEFEEYMTPASSLIM